MTAPREGAGACWERVKKLRIAPNEQNAPDVRMLDAALASAPPAPAPTNATLPDCEISQVEIPPPAPSPAAEDAGGLEAEPGFRQTYADAVARGRAMEAAGEGDAALLLARLEAMSAQFDMLRQEPYMSSAELLEIVASVRALAAALAESRADRERLASIRDCAPAPYLETVDGRLALVGETHWGDERRGDAMRTLIEQDLPRLLLAARRAGAAGGEASHA